MICTYRGMRHQPKIPTSQQDNGFGNLRGSWMSSRTLGNLPAGAIIRRSTSGQFHDLRQQPQVSGADRCTDRKGPFHVFAPTDEAFRKLPSGAHESLLKDSAKFKAVLNYHIVSGYLLAKGVKPGEIMTLQGSTLTAVVSSADVRVNGARITQADIAATNGIVHAIDTVILPKNWQ
jgi:uncharacterized surface protein with fasciclin (FAS1) repeats